MKKPFAYYLILVFLVGCNNDGKLTFEPLIIENDPCTNCPEVSINVPKALDRTKLARTINTALEEELISLLHFDDESELIDIDHAMVSFESGYQKLQDLYTDETTPWEAKIDAELVYEDPYLLTIALDAYIFTGGAHGYNSKRLLNFDKKKGVELENWQLFNSSLDFRNFAERQFRIKEKIPQDKPINYTGFMFEKDSFYLPENIGFTEKGLKLLYNQYEVSSFADGTLELTLPYTEVKKFLEPKVK